MHTAPALGQPWPVVGLHWLPRCVLEPHTSTVPFDVDTALQIGNWPAVWQALAPASGLHAM